MRLSSTSLSPGQAAWCPRQRLPGHPSPAQVKYGQDRTGSESGPGFRLSYVTQHFQTFLSSKQATTAPEMTDVRSSGKGILSSVPCPTGLFCKDLTVLGTRDRRSHALSQMGLARPNQSRDSVPADSKRQARVGAAGGVPGLRPQATVPVRWQRIWGMLAPKHLSKEGVTTASAPGLRIPWTFLRHSPASLPGLPGCVSMTCTGGT